MHQVLLAIAYIHESGLVHRDLKLENVMVQLEQDEDGSCHMICKLTDFGFACVLDDPQSQRSLNLTLGTPLYMAPEVIKGSGYGQKVDIWSLGVLTYLIMASEAPFDGSSKQDIYNKIKGSYKPDYSPLDKYWQNGALLKDFIQKCLQKNPSNRVTAQELLQHEWLRVMVDAEEVSEDQIVDTGRSLATYHNSSKLQSFVLSFLSSLKASRRELAKLRKVFKQLDQDNNGFLSREEIVMGMAKVGLAGSQGITQLTDWEAVFKSMDANNDGRVSFEEFCTAAYDQHKLMNKRNLQVAFNYFDENGDGRISPDELRNAFNRTALADGSLNQVRLTEDALDRLMSKTDKNQDGMIDFEEFHSYMLSLAEQDLTTSQLMASERSNQ
mgnify:CR=1 FL=1